MNRGPGAPIAIASPQYARTDILVSLGLLATADEVIGRAGGSSLVWLGWPLGCVPRRLPLVAFVLGPIALSLVAGPDSVALFARAFVHGLR